MSTHSPTNEPAPVTNSTVPVASQNLERPSGGRISWEGHEFLDSIRDQSVWEKTKTVLASSGVGMTLDFIKTVATKVASETLAKYIGIR